MQVKSPFGADSTNQPDAVMKTGNEPLTSDDAASQKTASSTALGSVSQNSAKQPKASTKTCARTKQAKTIAEKQAMEDRAKTREEALQSAEG